MDDLERKIVNIYQQLTNLECGFRMLRKLRNIFFSKVQIKAFAKAGSNAKLLLSPSVSLKCLLFNQKMVLSQLS